MALGTVTKPTSSYLRWDWVDGKHRVRIRDVQLTSGANYTTGGETINPTDVGMRMRIISARVLGAAKVTDGSTARDVAFDFSVHPAVKIQAYNGDAGVAGPDAEVGANTNLSTYTARIEFVGQ